MRRLSGNNNTPGPGQAAASPRPAPPAGPYSVPPPQIVLPGAAGSGIQLEDWEATFTFIHYHIFLGTSTILFLICL